MNNFYMSDSEHETYERKLNKSHKNRWNYYAGHIPSDNYRVVLSRSSYYGDTFTELLHESNWDSIIKTLEENNYVEQFEDDDGLGGDYYIMSASHWLVSWVEYLVIKIKDDNGNYTPIFDTLCEIDNDLESYPIYNEDDFNEREYEREYEEQTEYVNHYGPTWIKDIPNPQYAISSNFWELDGMRDSDIESNINSYLDYNTVAEYKGKLLVKFNDNPQLNYGTIGKIQLAVNEDNYDFNDDNPLVWFYVDSDVKRLVWWSDIELKETK